MKGSVEGVVDPFNERCWIGLLTFQQRFEIFCTGQVFVAPTFFRWGLAGGNECHLVQVKLANVIDRCAGDDKAGGKQNVCTHTPYNTLRPRARTLDDGSP